ncbi:MAG: aspartyl/glutamyl-tRNA amidotransferase subunit C [Deltaproteobacteria bacterium]|nr:aspartyl/glutamyl-tRNA amidotransferase subunit C [Deltaproteobacteria bacterium]
MSKWTKQDLENIAKLAKLRIQPESMHDRLREFSDILGHIEVLEQVQLDQSTETTSQTLQMFADTPQPCLPIEDVLKNATHADVPFFFIPKFIEGGKS